MAKPRKVGDTTKMVVSAVKKLMKHTGWTARTIVKFIRIEFGVNHANLGRQVSRALKACVRLRLLQNDSGRYRLRDMEAVCRPSGCTIQTEITPAQRRAQARQCRDSSPKTRPCRFYRRKYSKTGRRRRW